jgi:hypothetical protein
MNSIEFGNIFIFASSNTLTKTKASIAHSVFLEHGFGGFIGDSNIVSSIQDIVRPDKNVVCSVGVPFCGLQNDLIMNSLIYLESISDIKFDSFMIPLNKYDIENGNWENIRLFVRESVDLVDKDIYLSIDPTWFENPEDLSRIYSIISSFSSIKPVLNLNSARKNGLDGIIKTVGSVCQSNSTNKTSVFCTKLNNHSLIVNAKSYGFENVIISPSMAVSFSREY